MTGLRRLLEVTIGIALVVFGLLAGTAHADDLTTPATTNAEVVLTIFHGDGCPHCAAEIAFLRDELVPAFPDLQVRSFEVWGNAANRELMVQAGQEYGFDPGPVPVTIVEGPTGHQVFVGFGAPTGDQLTAVVEAELAATQGDQPGSPDADPAPSSDAVVEVPLLGEVDLAGSSLLVATLVIGFVDGVNPCSLWVLSVLLAIVLHSGSRGRVVLIGSVFLAVTAGMYAVYVAGVYSVLTVLDGLLWIRVLVALMALAFGLVQLWDGLRPGTGVSLSISAERRPTLYRRMRAVGRGDAGLLATVAGTAVLAVGVSLLETPCTAGLPLLWANLVAEQAVPTPTAVALFGVYMLVFLLDELLVFGVAVVSLRSLKLQQEHGQALKILAGSLLVTLAAVMIVAPAAMRTVPGTLAVFGVALVLGLTTWLINRIWGQARRQRVNSVASSARTMPSSDSPTTGSGEEPSTMR